MPCYHPLHGWRSRKKTKNGKWQIVFDVKNGYRDKPLSVPCGQCIGCRLERSRQWAIRCVHESQMHEKNCFITLTYNEESLNGNSAISPVQADSLVLEHFQNFMKRLRRKYGKLRFFHCGEYGSQTARPHYHACLFGFDFPDKKFLKMSGKHPIFTSQSLDKLWGHGICFIGEVSFESAAYVARYIMKKVTGPLAEKYYGGLRPEYTTMSRNPGIGADWLKKYKTDVFPDGEVVLKGKKMRPPRYYESQYELTNPEEFVRLKRLRKVEAALKADDNTDERLVVKEEIKNAAIRNLKRSL